MAHQTPDHMCPQCGAELQSPLDVCLVCRGAVRVADSLETLPAAYGAFVDPQEVGAYRILQRIGEGGMGVVYLAEQDKPIRRRVALKVIKLGMETREVIARFEAERQALALMDHPGIAHVYDAGATADGRPFFVMEYVAGLPITEYCDKHRLPLEPRLDLFVQICGAVQHAHQKGVIHRDLKPSNLLVSVQDGRAVPKVIDFGVAKAIHQRLTEKTLFTHHGMVVGTPAYMSPEQAEMGALDVDTTTDIYSLGVVLYELLVSAPPLDPQALRRAGYAEMQRLIREYEPPRPSTRLSSLQAAADAVAHQRRTSLSRLVRALKNDLDWITLKAMDKDRTRRYTSASELAADVTRHLNTEPIVARPPSLKYRLGKFVRQYRAALLAVTLGVVSATVVSTGVQTQNVLRTTARGLIDQEAMLRYMLFSHARSAVIRSPEKAWTAALREDSSLQTALEVPVATGAAVDVAAICDTEGRVVVSSYRAMTDCPSGRPLSELASVNVLSVLRGTTPSRAGKYVSVSPLKHGTNDIGSIRLGFSGVLVSHRFRTALWLSVVSCVAQIAAILTVALVACLLVFRRGVSQR